MRSDRELASKLRTSGKSYKQIREELGVPIATLSDWFSKHAWSKQIADKLKIAARERNIARIRYLGKIRGEHLARLYNDAREEARAEFEVLKYDPLFIAGVVIYWGEGDKASLRGFRVANSDPTMIKVFVQFLKTICQAD